MKIFDTIQALLRDPGTWNFQFKQTHADLVRTWIDAQLLPHLAAWFTDDEHGNQCSLTLKDMGAPVQKYATRNSHITKGDDASGQGSYMDAYLKASATFIPTS